MHPDISIGIYCSDKESFQTSDKRGGRRSAWKRTNFIKTHPKGRGYFIEKSLPGVLAAAGYGLRRKVFQQPQGAFI
jgi:hypothetical protein